VENKYHSGASINFLGTDCSEGGHQYIPVFWKK
jgi:hypothetical protein